MIRRRMVAIELGTCRSGRIGRAPGRQVASTEIGPADWLALRSAIHRIADAEPARAGFVIPHGTATLE